MVGEGTIGEVGHDVCLEYRCDSNTMGLGGGAALGRVLTGSLAGERINKED